MTEAFPMVEQAVKDLIETKRTGLVGKVTGNPPTVGNGVHVWLALIPGGGTTTQIDGTWAIDIDCMAKSYSAAMQEALALEAALIGSRHVTDLMILDNCYQNSAPSERPWDDETVVRIGASYVFTARRSG